MSCTRKSGRRYLAALVTVGLLAAAGCGSGGSGDTTKGPMKIGGLAPLSGEAAFIGENTLTYGATLAVTLANANGGVLGAPVELVTQDDERRTEATVSGFRTLMGHGVHAGVGPSSATIPGVLETLKAAHVPWIPVGSTSALDSGLEGSMVYRNFPSDSQQLPAMLIHAGQRGPRLGMVFENNASGQGQRAAAMQYLEGAGNVQLVDELLLAPGQSSYRSEVSEFLSQDYDAILWQLTDATASAFFSSAAEIGVLDGRYFVGTDAALAEETLRILAPYLGTATFTAVVPATDGAGLESYRTAFRSEFGSEPLVLADIGYDATTTLLLAAERAGDLAPEAIAARIPEVTSGGEACVDFKACAALIRAGKDADFEGAGNSLTFDETHNVTSNYVISAIAPDGTVTEQEKVTEEQIRTLVDAAK